MKSSERIETVNQPGELWLARLMSPILKLELQCCQQIAGCCQRVSSPYNDIGES